MLSYQHHYHAGNHADVLKHWMLLACIRHLQKKETPFDYIDTHAGAGLYQLSSSMARKTSENKGGILKINWQQLAKKNLTSMADFHAQIASNLQNRQYPGSPMLVKRLLRHGDKAWLFEMHPRTIEELRTHCEQRRRCFVRQEDGFQGLLGLMPTASRRALVLIDPSYEIKADYQKVVKAIESAYKKMPQATFLLWYPVVAPHQITQLEKGFSKSKMRNIHLFEMGVIENSEAGMSASGIIAVNPPWTLKDDFMQTIPCVSEMLSVDGKARYRYLELAAE